LRSTEVVQMFIVQRYRGAEVHRCRGAEVQLLKNKSGF
jgi:hypothetical protein